MTKKELIKSLILLKEQACNSGINTFIWDINIDGFNFVIDNAIKTLEQKPKTKGSYHPIISGNFQNPPKVKSAETKFIPPITPQEPRKGKWVHREDMDYLDKNNATHNHFMCNKCGFIHDFIDEHTSQYRYCPTCGSDNREVKE